MSKVQTPELADQENDCWKYSVLLQDPLGEHDPDLRPDDPILVEEFERLDQLRQSVTCRDGQISVILGSHIGCISEEACNAAGKR